MVITPSSSSSKTARRSFEAMRAQGASEMQKVRPLSLDEDGVKV
jgi:hypothetical protein